MKKKILIALLILGCTAGCGKVPKLSNGKEAVVSFEDTKISISADDLYNEIKEKYALSSLIDMIDNSILLKEYPNGITIGGAIIVRYENTISLLIDGFDNQYNNLFFIFKYLFN